MVLCQFPSKCEKGKIMWDIKLTGLSSAAARAQKAIIKRTKFFMIAMAILITQLLGYFVIFK